MTYTHCPRWRSCKKIGCTEVHGLNCHLDNSQFARNMDRGQGVPDMSISEKVERIMESDKARTRGTLYSKRRHKPSNITKPKKKRK